MEGEVYKKALLGKVSRIARIKGFSLSARQQIALAEFLEDVPQGEKAIVGVANLLRRRREPFDGDDVLAMAQYLT